MSIYFHLDNRDCLIWNVSHLAYDINCFENKRQNSDLFCPSILQTFPNLAQSWFYKCCDFFPFFRIVQIVDDDNVAILTIIFVTWDGA